MTQNATELGWAPEEPTARGVANAVSRAIRDGILKPGMKLPPIRAVAAELEVSPTTISSAWSILGRSGTIHTDGRRGTRVADINSGSVRYRSAVSRHNLHILDLSTGVPDPKLLPALGGVLDNLTTAITPSSYLDHPVVPELIDQIRSDWSYEAQAFTITDGAMDALEMITRAVVRFGDRVIVEDPTFPLLIDQLEAAGAEIVGVPLDDQGMLVEPLVEALKKPASAVFLQPRAQNPTGISLSSSRAQELAAVVAPTKAMIIEDDSAGSVAWTEAISLGQWLPERTLHVRSFSKSHGPDLRLAAMSGPLNLIQEIDFRRQLGQGWTSRLLQRVLLGLLTDESSISQVAYARSEYRRRRVGFVDALASRHIPVAGSDGINVWVPVADESAAIVRLASQGIGVAPGAPFSVLSSRPHHIRVTVASMSGSRSELVEMIAVAAEVGSRTRGR